MRHPSVDHPTWETPFKVIVVGAGVAGLTLAHCLEKANIDYVVLDKGIVAPPFGTTITMQPHGCRILDQLGCLDAVLSQCSTMKGCSCRTSTGKVYAENRFFEVIQQYSGYSTCTLDRRVFLRTLYNQLRDKSKVLERCRVENIIEETGIVKVLLADGTEHVGNLVVGADGVHSKVRELMWDKANRAIPGSISAAEKRSMATTYNALIAMCPPVPGLSKHDMEITSGNGFSFLLLCQPTFITFIAHCKLPEAKRYRWPNRGKYTEEEMEALASKLADCPVTETVLFGELWRSRTKGQLISLEEGVLKHWFFGRIVLAGDAIHKITPNSALGGCTAMESVVSIANAIHGLVHAHPNKEPSDVEIRDALQHYQDSRLDRVKGIVEFGAKMTRLQAYDGWWNYITQRWITPVIGLDCLARDASRLFSGTPKLNYVPFEGKAGKLGWNEDSTTRLTRSPGKKAARGGRALKRILPVVVGTLMLLSSTLWWVISGDMRHASAGFGAFIKFA
ncbi:FAD dependent oxidoreductase domain containing protein [Coccidioides posadasii C735 delta SOWgp]|uniref:FAD dependent oxidoreductase domain containing protein n=1 Tax=Coccidioides posadasii (strain C735) TaxID=222929 RepID=C5PGG7_COCP7|nr:FAD dependent oxidoreductase domain containing protein [Coccidioides posadasii C735 delta SOWgp]EER23620.1 FAD dependent oxidoreductase domain containing protein [Coccidioides posadasii C735 delta SOWgp]|eukprot:XP_003065765.1 FAD dependent oxidoreductase domain containing protein [Coccidioides posadasii C735 delta SOWgp]